jgi:predicted transcriptional regulator
MKKKRERIDVIFDILTTVQSKKMIGPTRLLQMSNLSPKMFRDYIDELVESGLLTETVEKGKKYFLLNDKSYIFLEKYKIFTHFIDKLGL